MYDTIGLRLEREEGQSSFLMETPCYLDCVAEHYHDGELSVTGRCNNLDIVVTENRVKVRNSLCKFYYGDNFQTLDRKSVRESIDMLSDLLHLDMNDSKVTRLDVAQNLILKSPVEAYLRHLGTLRYFRRLLTEATGLYYRKQGEVICFYDKVREQKQIHNPIPELYAGRNVLRCEHRYLNRIPKRLNRPSLTAKELYDESFYVDVIERLKEAYHNIQKEGRDELNFEAMKTKTDVYQLGLVALSAYAGGQTALLERVGELPLSRKQRHDIKKAIIDACSSGALFVQSEHIQELDKKMNQAMRYYS